MDKSYYHRQYYKNHYKDIIKNKKTFCECCQVEVSSWNIWKHRQSKKHTVNNMTEDERKEHDANLRQIKLLKKIQHLESQL